MRRSALKYWLVDDHPPSNPDCFVVPSYALKNAETPTLPTCAELKLAAEWWCRFSSASVIVSTGDNQRLGVSNASVMARYVEDLGVPRDQIIEEDRSLNTFENLTNCRRLIDDRRFRQPTLVTLDLYTRRAVAVALKQGWNDVHWVSAWSPGEPAAGWKWLQTHSRTTIFFYELGAMIYCKLAGWA